MRVKAFLHKLLLPVMHKKRLNTLIILVNALFLSKKLSLTGLGRNLDHSSSILERSGIRKVDRFLGNKKLELKSIYQSYILSVIGSQKRPNIIIDWSQIPNTAYYLLRATLASEGRGLTLYEEVHPKDKLGNPALQRQFLNTLKAFLPSECIPIIITDAGFCNPWFKHVLKLKWDFIGRVRGLHTYYDGQSWKSCKLLHQLASIKAKSINDVILCKRESILLNLVLIKSKLKNMSRNFKRKRGGGKDVGYYRGAAKEPWVLATSLKENLVNAKKIVKLYKLRMQIEEGFRDLKYGFDLRHAYSKIKERIQILLLIGMFATLIASLAGYIAEKNNWHFKFQTNSIKSRRVLSWFFLGCRIIKQKIKIGSQAINKALYELQTFF